MSKGLWVKLSVAYFDDERIMEVGAEAELLFVRGLAWAKRGGKGTVGRGALVRLGLGLSDVQTALQGLVRAGLWQATDDGWLIVAWDEWQSDHSDARSKAGTLGSHRRWHRTPVANCEHCMANAWQMPSVCDSKPIAEKEKEKEKETHTRSRTATGDFEQWWNVWPKKIAKGAARKAYDRACRRAEPSVLLTGAQHMAREWVSMEADRRQFVPHPATWLNGERWLDVTGDEAVTRPAVSINPDCPVCHGEGIVRVGGDDSNTWAACVPCRGVA